MYNLFLENFQEVELPLSKGNPARRCPYLSHNFANIPLINSKKIPETPPYRVHFRCVAGPYFIFSLTFQEYI